MDCLNRYAVLVGCTYNGVIHGSINNVDWMQQTLQHRFHFQRNNITVLKDDSSDAKQPTKNNIKEAIGNWINKAVFGDVIFFYFSGGGTRCDNQNQAHQCIVTSDLQHISDQYFNEDVLAKLPVGTAFTMVVEASYSGHLIDKPPQPTPNQQVQADGGRGILLSACDQDELAYEYGPDGNVYGAFTYALKQVLDKHPPPITNRELISEAKTAVANEGFPKQHPRLYCDNILADVYFLFQM